MKEIHDRCHREFSDENEAEITRTIISDYVAVGKLFTCETFRALISQFLTDHGRDPTRFKCSSKFIFDFKQRNGFSSRRFHVRRPNPSGLKENIPRWIREVKDLLLEYDDALPLVVNCDETAWRILPCGLLTWAPVGADGVTVRIDGNEKDSVTVLASVTASGEKLPLFAIAKGKTTRVEQSQLGTNEAIIRDHSSSSWSTIETFQHYLNFLAKFYQNRIPDGRQLHLILDCYSVHRSRDTREYARHLGIKLWFIPAGQTEELHPLDRAVFGAIKSIFRRKFEELCRESPNGRVSKSVAIEILLEIWEGLSPAAIHRGWAIYEEDFGFSDDAHDASWEE
jgi:hypothetical protein